MLKESHLGHSLGEDYFSGTSSLMSSQNNVTLSNYWQVNIPSTVVPKDDLERAIFLGTCTVSKNTADPTIPMYSVSEYINEKSEQNKGDGLNLSAKRDKYDRMIQARLFLSLIHI